MKRLTKRWGEQPYPNLAGKVICEYKECDSAKSCKDCVHGRIAERLAAYEDTGLEPEDILRILDAYGRGMTLRTESAQRLEIVKGIQTDRLRELAMADREGRVVVFPFNPPKTVWVCSREFPKPVQSHYASAINILWDMDSGYVFGDTPKAAEEALKAREQE